MRNAEIAAHFDELGDRYELDGAVVYRVVAYRNAAKAIREAPVSVEEMARNGRVTEVAGEGKQEQLREIAGFGRKSEEAIALALDAGDIAPSARILHSQAAELAEKLVS